MKKLLINLALLSLGALAFAAATLIPPMTAHAALAAGPVAADPLDWMAYAKVALAAGTGVVAILGILLAGLRWLAPRTKTTVDDRLRDEFQLLHDKLDGALKLLGGLIPATGVPTTVADPKPAAPPLAVVPPPGSSGAALLVVLLLGALAAPALSGCTKAEAGAAATAAGHAVVNCTGQAIGTTPALDLATLIAIASQAQEVKTACTSGGRFDWSCAESAAIAKGVTIGGCALAQLLATPPPTEKPAIASTAVAPAQPDPGRAAFEDFRARVAGGALFHTAAGDL